MRGRESLPAGVVRGEPPYEVPPMRHARRQKGTSLTEVAISLAILATTMLGTVAALVSGSALAHTTSETRAAQRAATSIFEEIRATPVDELVATYDDTTRHVVSLDGKEDGRVLVRVDRIDDGLTGWAVYEVAVIVRWDRSGTPRDIELRTLVSDRVKGSGLATQTVIGNQVSQ